MRPIRHDDLTAAACAIYPLARADRSARLRHLLQVAQWADLYRRRFRRAHPFWGDGSLGGAARMARLIREPSLSDPVYQSCLALVLLRCLDHKSASGGGGTG